MVELVPTDASQMLRMSAALKPLLRRLVGDASADDVLQDTWLAALERPPRHGWNPVGWLRAVSKNIAWKHRRSEGRRREHEAEAARRSSTRSRASAAEALDAYRRLLDAVRSLDAPLRDVVVGRYLEGRGARDLALRLGVSRATVDRRLRQGLDALRERLGAGRARDPHRPSSALFAMPLESERATGGTAPALATAGGTAIGVKVVAAAVVLVALGLAGTRFFRLKGAIGPESPPPRDGLPAAAPAPGLAGMPRARRDDPADSASMATSSAASLDPEAWLLRLNDARTDEEARQALLDLDRLAPEDTLAILRAIYDRIQSAARRHHVIDHHTHMARYHVHEYAASILDLGVRDSDSETAGFALANAANYALKPLALEDGTYAAWRREILDRRIGEVLSLSARDAARRIAVSDDEALLGALHDAGDLHAWFAPHHGVDVGPIAREQGAWDRCIAVFRDASRETNARLAALRFLGFLGPDRAFVDRDLLPIVLGRDDAPEALLVEAVPLVLKHGGPEGVEAVLRAFERFPPFENGHAALWEVFATALARAEAKRGIPTLVAAIESRPLTVGSQDVLEQALHSLSGVDRAPGRDAAWWRAWWLENRTRLSPDFATLEIPTLRLRPR